MPGGIRWVARRRGRDPPERHRRDRDPRPRPAARRLRALAARAAGRARPAGSSPAALACLGSRRSPCWAVEPTYDPWAWIIWGREVVHRGPGRHATARRGSRCRSSSPPRSRCSATTPRRSCGSSSRARRAARHRDGLPARGAAGRAGGRDRRGRAAARRRVRAQLRARELRGPARRVLPVALERHLDGRRATRSCSASSPACCARRCGRSGACTGCGWPRWRGRPPVRTARVAARLLTLVLWFLPEYLGSGSTAARGRARASPTRLGAFASGRSSRCSAARPRSSAVPVYVGAAIAVVQAWRDWREPVATVAARSRCSRRALMIAVALMTKAASPATCATSRCRPR